MRVLTIGTLYPPHDEGGGYEILWEAAVRGLRERGHEVRVLATDHRVAGAGPDGADVHRELRWYWQDHGFPRGSLRDCLAIERHNAAVLRCHVAEFAPDRIGWWALGGLSMGLLETARGAGVPSVAFVIDDWLDYGPRADGWHRRFAGRPRLARAARRLSGVPTQVAFADAAHYAFVSATTRDRAWFAGASTPERSIVRAGVDARFVDPAPPREWDWSLLYVGRVDRRKGIETAVEALARLPEATLTVAGAGPDIAPLRARAAALGVTDRVRLLGGRPRAELPALYAAADAVVFPVLWEEPWGLVPLEAMGRGRPVVATGRGGSAEYLADGENALLFPAGDATALAERLCRLAEDPELRAQLNRGGTRTAAAHTETAIEAAIEATLLAAHRRAPAPPAPAPPRVGALDSDCEVVLFLADGLVPAPGLERAHAEAHRLRPDARWAIQGAVDRPRDGFTRWLAGRGHPPLGPPAPGEIGPVRLDLAHASIKRSLLERAGGVGPGGLDLAHRLAALGLRLRFEPGARARQPRPNTVEDVRACLPHAARAERALVARLPHLVPRLHERAAHAAARGPARGRLGRPLVAYVGEHAPLLGPPVWRNATDHYDGLLAPDYLRAWDT